MAATMRSTPNYSVPPTQNTAPVLEFRCLYTHDLLKKQKKWHDGSLKFHTFNRRVMVYDDVKNYVGDLHYREQEEFGEGIELQLDRPVKVEVGEPIGRTETDLAFILDRGRAEREVRSSTDVPSLHRPVQRVHTSTQSGKPRSLMDVLGMSQGRIGRGRMPLQSPFEQRQQLAQPSTTPPPAKRQRMTDGKENAQRCNPNPTIPAKHVNISTTSVQPVASRRKQQVEVAPTVTKVTQSSISLQNRNLVQQRQQRSELPQKTIAKPSKATSGSKEKRKLPIVRETNGMREVIDITKTPWELREEEKSPKNGPTSRKATVVLVPEVASPGALGDLGAATRVPMARLRFQAAPPRKKLLYKALLPDGHRRTPKNPVRRRNNLVSPRNSHRFDTISNLSDVAVRDVAITVEDDSAQDTPEAITGSMSSSHLSRPANVTSKQSDAVLISSSPMFFSQDVSQTSQPSPPAMTDDGMDCMPVEDGDNCACIDEAMASAADANTIGVRLPSPSVRLVSDVQHHTDDCEQSYSASEAACPTAQEAHETSPSASLVDKSGGVRHSTSPEKLPQDLDGDLSDPILTHINTSHGQSTDPVISPSHRRDMASSPVPVTDSPMKQALQRGQSDSAALAQMAMAPPITVRPSQWVQPKKDDQGPWTKLEAFLLFDKWPAAKIKEKPDFQNTRAQDTRTDDDFNDYDGIQDHIELSMDTHVRTNVRSCRVGAGIALPGIRSARAVLRDEF